MTGAVTVCASCGHTACQHSQPSGKESPFGKGLREEEEVDHWGFSEGRIKGQPRLWGLTANSLRSFNSTDDPEGWRERESNLAAKGGYLYSVKEGRVDLKSISILSFFYSLLWGFQVMVDGKAGPQDRVLLAVSILAVIMYTVSEERYLTMPSNSMLFH